MPRQPSQTFTDKELEIMQVIWDVGEASVKDIQDRLPGDRHYNSVLTIIRVLERKGHLIHRVDGRAYIYSASENHEKARRRVLTHLVENVFGGSAASMVLQLVETGDLTRQDIEQIRQKIATRESEKVPGPSTDKSRSKASLRDAAAAPDSTGIDQLRQKVASRDNRGGKQ